jgi:hypothetical protein
MAITKGSGINKSLQLSAVSFQQTGLSIWRTELESGVGALECGSLLPLFSRELARASLARVPPAAHGQQAGLNESGSKLPHSKAAAPAHS